MYVCTYVGRRGHLPKRGNTCIYEYMRANLRISMYVCWKRRGFDPPISTKHKVKKSLSQTDTSGLSSSKTCIWHQQLIPLVLFGTRSLLARAVTFSSRTSRTEPCASVHTKRRKHR